MAKLPKGAGSITLRGNAAHDFFNSLIERPKTLHEGVRQSFLKAVEISMESGKLGDGDKSDLLWLYERLWPKAPPDIRSESLRSSQQHCEGRKP